MRVGENLEVIAAHKRNERHAGLLGSSEGKSRRRRNRDEDRASQDRGFLHHLDRQPTRDGYSPL